MTISRRDEVARSASALRGSAARNAAKTHCPAGHLLSGDNVYNHPQGKRRCRECQRVARRASEARARAKSKGPPPPQAPERLSAQLRSTDTGCMEWTGAVNRKGYGDISHEGVVKKVHRLVYEIAKGPIPDGLHIDHLCFNRRCCNPDHLEAVTPAENNRRSVARQRAQRGEVR